MKKVLITGGAGFIGSSLALELIDKGFEVVVMDNLSPQIHGNPERSFTYNRIIEKVQFIHGDVRNKTDWERALNDVSCVIHLAAETGTGQSMYELSTYSEINLTGTANLFEVVAKNKSLSVNHVIYASSRSIYGEGRYNCKKCGVVYPKHREDSILSKGFYECTCPSCGGLVELLKTDENSRIHPSSFYGITKQTQEDIVKVMCTSLKMNFTALRFQNVYGPGQSLSNPYTGILSIFSNLIRSGKNINIFEDGNESRDFVYIDDVVNSIYLSLTSEKALNKIYNVGSGVGTSVKRVANELINAFNSDIKFSVTGNYRIGDIRHNVADLTLIKSDLDFVPKINFSEGISRFVNWVKSQDISDNNFQKSMDEMKKFGLLK